MVVMDISTGLLEIKCSKQYIFPCVAFDNVPQFIHKCVNADAGCGNMYAFPNNATTIPC